MLTTLLTVDVSRQHYSVYDKKTWQLQNDGLTANNIDHCHYQDQ